MSMGTMAASSHTRTATQVWRAKSMGITSPDLAEAIRSAKESGPIRTPTHQHARADRHAEIPAAKTPQAPRRRMRTQLRQPMMSPTTRPMRQYVASVEKTWVRPFSVVVAAPSEPTVYVGRVTIECHSGAASPPRTIPIAITSRLSRKIAIIRARVISFTAASSGRTTGQAKP